MFLNVVCSDLGKNIVLENFEGSIVTFKSSGVLYPIQVNMLCEALHKLINDDLWTKALALCRRMQVYFFILLSIMQGFRNEINNFRLINVDRIKFFGLH